MAPALPPLSRAQIPRAGSRAPHHVAALVILAAASASLGACAPQSVVRVFDGQEVVGRFIDERAYALYARAADAEAHGEKTAALAFYEAAADSDEQSPEIWTRVGAMRCKTGAPEKAVDAFRRALTRDPDYEPAWREMAICALVRGDLGAATVDADRALLLDPERVETATTHAAVTERVHGSAVALRELEALTVRSPGSVAAWRALDELALRSHDEAARARAAAAMRSRSPGGDATKDANAPPPNPFAAIDAALARGDLDEARRHAIEAHLLASEVAVRAAALGEIGLARAEAALIAGADPSDGSALLALAVAADLARDEPGLERALRSLPHDALTPPSRLARLLFAELVDRRSGPEAARAWLGSEPTRTGDPLLARIEERVSAKLYPSKIAAGP